MKKLYVFILMFIVGIGVVACVPKTTTETSTTSPITAAPTTAVPTTVTTVVTTVVTEAPDVTLPIFTGIADAVIYAGDPFSVLAGIAALDDRDGTITDRIVVSGDYDIATPGTYTITYTVSDNAGNEAIAYRELRVREALLNSFYIVNGDFSDPLEAPWGQWAGDGGACTTTIVDGVLVYDVTAIGSLTYSNQFSQVDRIVETGKIYQLTFMAKADDVRPLKVQLEDRSDYTLYWNTTVDLTTDWETYTFAFEVTLPSITTGKLGFFLGNIGTTSVATTVYLDNIVITELEELPGDHTAPVMSGLAPYTVELGLPFDSMAGVSVTDDYDLMINANDIVVTGSVNVNVVGVYTLTYTVEDESGNVSTVERQVTVSTTPPTSVFVVPNPDFSVNQTVSSNDGWLWKTGGNLTAAFTAQISGGEATIEVTNLGDVSYGVQFYLLNRLVEQGRTYQITFDAKVDTPRPIQVVLENGSYARQFDYTFNVTTSWQTFTIEYYHANATMNNGKFGFFLGLVGTTSVTTTIHLDNVIITAVPTVIDNTDPVISGADDITIELDSTFDPLYGITVSDDRDMSLTVLDIVLTGDDLLDTSVEGDYTITYTLTDASGNETTVSRVVSVREGTAPSTLVVANGDFQKDQFVPVSDDGWFWKTGTGGAFTATIDNGIAQINVTNIGLVPHGVQFYQTNRITVQDTVYIITFSAKADMPRPIKLIMENGSTYARLLDVDVYLTTEWQTFTVEFNYTIPGITNAKFGFFLGAVLESSVPTTIYLDNVSIVTADSVTDIVAPSIIGASDLILVQNATFDPLLGVTIWDFNDKVLTKSDLVVTGTVDSATLGEYQLTYSLTDASGNVTTLLRNVTVVASGQESTFTLVNADFEIPQAVSVTENGWYWKINGTGAFTAGIADGIATVDVTALGTVPYGVQFYQQNRVLESGSMYKITFSAKADIARDLQLAVEGGASGTTRLFDQNFNITTEWATYTTTVCFGNQFSFNNGKFGLYLGLVSANSVVTTFYFDNFVIELIGYVDDTSAPIIVGATNTTILKDAVFNPLTNVVIYDLYDRILSVSDIVITGDQITDTDGVYTFDSSVAGIYTVTYTLTDKAGNETVINRIVTVNETAPVNTFVVPNADFEIEQLVSDLAGWSWKTGTGGAFTLAIQNGQVEVDVTNIGLVPHGVQLNLLNRSIVQNTIYKITFSAKADDPRPIKMVVENGSTYARLLDVDVYLTNGWVTYTAYFAYNSASIANAKFAFFLGAVLDDSVPTKIYIDNITVEIVSAVSDTQAPSIYGVDNSIVKLGETFDPMLGVTVWDQLDTTLLASHIKVTGTVDTSVAGDYSLTYTVRDASGNVGTFVRVITVSETLLPQAFTLTNGDFETPQTVPYPEPAMAGWGWKINGTGAFTVNIADGVAAINVTALGTVPYGVQFYQQNRTYESGNMYKITFMAKADIARPIQVAFEGGATGTTRLWDQIFNITTEWETYTAYICLPKTFSFENGKLGFYMGLVGTTSVTTTIYLDDVVTELVGYVVDTKDPFIVGATDVAIAVDAVFNPLSGVSVFDILDKTITTADIVITGDQITDTDGVYTFNSSIAGIYTVTYSLTDKSGNEVVIVRTVTVS